MFFHGFLSSSCSFYSRGDCSSSSSVGHFVFFSSSISDLLLSSSDSVSYSMKLESLRLEYVVDAADYDNVPVSRSELHDLLSKPSLNGIPLLVLGNKIDKQGALSKEGLTEQLGLKDITDREVCCFMISCKNSSNIDSVIDWLVKHSKSMN
uniref:Uncharacterized protein n=1 Tax=Quercus lobata TaxID=97700 RepID=A0A7N2RDD3_QUELO